MYEFIVQYQIDQSVNQKRTGGKRKLVLLHLLLKIKIIFYPNDALNKNIQVIRATAHELYAQTGKTLFTL